MVQEIGKGVAEANRKRFFDFLALGDFCQERRWFAGFFEFIVEGFDALAGFLAEPPVGILFVAAQDECCGFRLCTRMASRENGFS